MKAQGKGSGERGSYPHTPALPLSSSVSSARAFALPGPSEMAMTTMTLRTRVTEEEAASREKGLLTWVWEQGGTSESGQRLPAPQTGPGIGEHSPSEAQTHALQPALGQARVTRREAEESPRPAGARGSPRPPWGQQREHLQAFSSKAEVPAQATSLGDIGGTRLPHTTTEDQSEAAWQMHPLQSE